MTASIFRNAAVLGTIVLAVSLQAGAGPVIDGRFDPGEGYTSGHSLVFAVEGSNTIVQDGQLWTHQDQATGDLSVYFLQPLTLVDNTYGANSIGWGKGVAPSGKNHSFKDLVGSDKARFVFNDTRGNIVLDITADYFSETARGSRVYDSMGVLGGKDSAVDVGSPGDVLEWSSSLDYNFNVLNHTLTMDSPATDLNYSENPDYQGWIFEVGYELRVAGSVFGANGFGDVTIPIVHDSPNKIGKNKVYPTPEPATMILLIAGIPLFLKRRQRQAGK